MVAIVDYQHTNKSKTTKRRRQKKKSAKRDKRFSSSNFGKSNRKEELLES
jgi:hypothetical protein